LVGLALWSTRVGDWRLVFEIRDEVRIVDVQRIEPRGGVYRRL
jgi:mRNA-degrading endonuclease RelE of RelBE toxin-antitoxin system